MSLGSFFSKIGHAIATFFGSHQAVIQAVIADAQTAAGAATTVATALGEPAAVTAAIARVSDGLAKAGAAVAVEQSATTLTQHASNLAALVTGITPDIGIKNAQTTAAIGATLVKVQSVVGALETAAVAASPVV